MKLISVFLSLFICSVEPLKILGIFPYQGKSHFFVFKVYLEELARRGHNVTVISHFPVQNSTIQDHYHDISLAGTVKVYEDDVPVSRSYLTILQIGLFLTNSGVENCKILVSNPKVQDLLKQKQNFDVIVVEQFNSDCSLGVAYKLNAPVVGLTSHVFMPWHYARFGVPNNPSYVPFHFLEGGTQPTLYQRVERVLFNIYFNSIYYFITQRSDQNTLAEYIGDVPNLEDLAREIKYVLLYQNFVLTGSRLFPANVIEVGGFHVSKPKQLPNELNKFIEESKQGVIYISFGSVLKASTLPLDKLEAILGAIRELPYRFVWKWEDESQQFDNNKVFVSKWLPQTDILAHPNTVAFFSHGGMLGTSEAIHYGVPVIVMPVVGDQPANAAAIEESGLGVQLQIRDLTKENLLAAFKKVLDPKFHSNVKQLSKAWHDRPMTALDSAIFWTEFAARYPNSTFRTPAADVPLYQYLHLDILIVVTILIVTVLTILRWFVKIFSKSANNTSSKKKTKKSKKE